MENYKFGITNILNAIKFKIFVNQLKSNKKSIKQYINKIRKKNIYSIILTKLLLTIWLALNKWLYDETEGDAGLAIINGVLKE